MTALALVAAFMMTGCSISPMSILPFLIQNNGGAPSKPLWEIEEPQIARTPPPTLPDLTAASQHAALTQPR